MVKRSKDRRVIKRGQVKFKKQLLSQGGVLRARLKVGCIRVAPLPCLARGKGTSVGREVWKVETFAWSLACLRT